MRDQAIADRKFPNGIEKLFLSLIQPLRRQKNQIHAEALAPLTAKRLNNPFLTVSLNTYRSALRQIQEDGDFKDHADIGLLAHVIHRNVYSSLSGCCGLEKVKPSDLSKYNVCIVSSALTNGHTDQQVTKIVISLKKALKKLDTN